MDTSFSEYIVYVDESGDHSLESIDPDYPVFVLAFCIFHKEEYANNITPAIQKFKFEHFGHDIVLLHERDIRKAQKEFSILLNHEIRNKFFSDMNMLISESEFTLICVIINKERHNEKFIDPSNPYHISLQFGLERVFVLLKERLQVTNRTHFIFESRGKKEDKDLQHEFQRVCEGMNQWKQQLPFEMIIADKKTNSCGLQIADLVARPVGRYVINPVQKNRSFEIIAKKFYRNNGGSFKGLGLKCFP